MSAYVCPKCGCKDIRGKGLLSWSLQDVDSLQSLEKNTYFCACGFESGDLADFDPDSLSGNIILYWLNKNADRLIDALYYNGLWFTYVLREWINEDVSRFNEEAMRLDAEQVARRVSETRILDAILNNLDKERQVWELLAEK